jgi:hypothetical protein
VIADIRSGAAEWRCPGIDRQSDFFQRGRRCIALIVDMQARDAVRAEDSEIQRRGDALDGGPSRRIGIALQELQHLPQQGIGRAQIGDVDPAARRLTRW